MKKYFGLLICLFVLNACDDGEMTFDTFDFSEVSSEFCADNKLLYKINGNEALVLQINNAADAFPFRNVLGVRSVALSNISNKVYYRTFNGDVPETYFCSDIPPSSPIVTSEYVSTNSSNGFIEITTTLVPGTTTITNPVYLHSIVLKNITFVNAQGGTIIYDELNFGTYSTKSNVSFEYNDLPVQSCAPGKFFKVIDTNLANIAGTENLNKFLELSIPLNRFPTVATQEEKVFLSEADGVSAIYRIYNGDIENADYCSEVATLDKQEEWKAQEGFDAPENTDDIGYFLITASTDPITAQLVYAIVLKKFTFNRAFPVDPSGAPVGTFTSAADINFGTISIP